MHLKHQICITFQRIAIVKGEESKWKRKEGDRKRKDEERMKIKLIMMGNGKGSPVFVRGLWAQGPTVTHQCANAYLRSSLQQGNW